jgi:hypothetical protein
LRKKNPFFEEKKAKFYFPTDLFWLYHGATNQSMSAQYPCNNLFFFYKALQYIQTRVHAEHIKSVLIHDLTFKKSKNK